MFKAPDHQVAGHQAGRRGNIIGPLIDDSGHFYKPLQDGERGTTELRFYTSLASNDKIPDDIRQYFPAFHGSKLLDASDGSGQRQYIVLQDLVSSRPNPSVMDIKIGSRTWYPQASDEYIAKCLKRDRESTSLLLGFMICGLQTYVSQKTAYWKPDREVFGKTFTKEDVRASLKRFVSSNPLSDDEPDCSFASIVYGGSDGILAQLLEMKAWFEVQTIYQFNSCSVLMMYDTEAGDASARRSHAKVKLVDFAHVKEGQGVIDHNFLGGLCSLIHFVSEVLTSTGDTIEDVSGCKKNQILSVNDRKQRKIVCCFSY